MAPASTASTSASNNPGTQSSQLAQISLNAQVMGRFKPAKIIKGAIDPPPTPTSASPRPVSQPTRHITGITFDDRGDTVLTAAEDETFRLYNCKTGKHVKTMYSKKYGIDLPRFTHKSSAIVYASTKEDDTIRYHSLHDNKYLQYFKGHKQRVVSLEVSPTDDGFMSGSVDRTVRLWDLRSPSCRGLLHLPSSPLVAYDSSGVVFAVAINTFSRILLYDMNNFDKEPFLTMALEDPTLAQISFPPRQIYMTSLSFSSSGSYLLVGTSGDAHYILDAFEGHLLAKLEGHIGLERGRLGATLNVNPTKGISGEEVCWTPDSKFIVGGSLDGKMHVWDVHDLPARTGEPVDLSRPPLRLVPVATLDGQPSPTRCVKFNPRLAMIVAAGSELAFWLPDNLGDSEDVKDLLKKKAL